MSHSDDLAIRMRRATFNRALADADLTAIGPLLIPNAILVTGTDSVVLSGRKAQIHAWKSEFAAAERTLYVRITETITVSPVEPIAMEYGHWQGAKWGSDEVLASGTYAAKWRRVGPDWLIEAEIYLTIA